jgi:peptidyl-prolyl cis-trans isomerase B (cyclophilin B)
MALVFRHGPRWPGLLCLAGLALSGCGKKSSTPTITESKSASPSVSVPAAPSTAVVVKEYERLHQSFLEATRKEAPPDQRPSDRTMTGKSTAKLYGEVVKLWDTIEFMKRDGTLIQYSATIETDLGTIELDLDATRAPNHVRNFVALSKVGYYDGLVFDRIHLEEPDLQDGIRYEEIEAGCPLGTGEPDRNSIGYWLQPEISPGAVHEEGVIGACRGIEKDTAACKFYITLCKAPYLDGEYTAFGKVTRGLDVARKIFLQPVILEDADVEGSRRPLKPVVMRKVTIHTREGGPVKENLSRR